MEIVDSRICRTCMVEVKLNQTLHYIYDCPTENSSESIAEILLRNLPQLVIQLKDALPKNICMQCLNSLVMVSSFHEMCLETQRKLFELFGSRDEEQCTNIEGPMSIKEAVPLPDPLALERTNQGNEQFLEDNAFIVKEEVDIDEEMVKAETCVEIEENPAIGQLIDLVDKTGKEAKDASSDRTMPLSNEPLEELLVSNNADNFEGNKLTTERSIEKPIINTDSNTQTNANNSKEHEYVCKECEKGFMDSDKLIKHFHTIHGKYRFHCMECSKGFPKFYQLKRHFVVHKETDKNQLEAVHRDLYKNSNNNTSDLTTPQTMDTTINCSSADKLEGSVMSTDQSIEQPITNIDHNVDDDPQANATISKEHCYVCKECNKDFTGSNNMIEHLRSHHGDHKFHCLECCKGFPKIYNLKRHLNVHKKLDKSNSEVGENTKDILSIHVDMYRKQSESPLKCLDCGISFKKIYNLRRHLQQVHKIITNKKIPGTEEQKPQYREMYKKFRQESRKLRVPCAKNHVCEHCQRAFRTAKHLEYHVTITHSEERRYLCSDCGKAFTSSALMNKHMMRHTSDFKYACPICPLKFRVDSDRTKHKAKHAKLRRFPCDQCGAAFTTSYSLKVHKLRHTNVKPYKCEFCEMRFVIRSSQRVHQRTHTGEKPFKCKYCGRAFGKSGDMRKHLRLHLGENVFRCELCPQLFRTAALRREHFMSHKNDDEATRSSDLKALQEEEAKVIAAVKANI